MKISNKVRFYVFSIFFILGASFFIGDIVDAAETTVVEVNDEGNTVQYPITSVPKITLNGNLILMEEFPAVKIDGVWMVPAKEFFKENLDFGYSYREGTKTLTLTDPAFQTTVSMTLGSNIAVCNGKSVAMNQKLLSATELVSGRQAFLVPLAFLAEQAAYSCSVTDSAITLTTDIVYYCNQYAAEDQFDSEVYSNILRGFVIRQGDINGQRIFQLNTLKTISSQSISFSDQPEEYAVTITLSKTQNALKNFTHSFSSGSIRKVQVWEDSNQSAKIKIWYHSRYIYTKKTVDAKAVLNFSKGTFSIKVLLPKKVNSKKITTTDQYWKKRFLIIIPGDHISYYKNHAPVSNSSVIRSIKVSRTADKNTKLTITTSKLQGYRLSFGNRFFTVKVGSPKSIYDNIVMLDAGHGGKDSGAVGRGLKEKKLNFNILYTKAKKYFDSLNSNVKAYWTRHSDTFINLYSRPKYSKKYNADLFVSLHMNSSYRSSVNGIEVYYSRNNNRKVRSGLNSKLFAKKMLNTLASDLDLKKRGVKQAGFVVTKYNSVPSILIELGFLSGSRDHRKLRKTSFQTKAAKSIYRGIDNVFKAYPTGR